MMNRLRRLIYQLRRRADPFVRFCPTCMGSGVQIADIERDGSMWVTPCIQCQGSGVVQR